jgi:hypothetical protein
VERLETADRHVVGSLPTAPAAPFFDSALLPRVAPPDGLAASPPSSIVALDGYAAG